MCVCVRVCVYMFISTCVGRDSGRKYSIRLAEECKGLGLKLYDILQTYTSPENIIDALSHIYIIIIIYNNIIIIII